MDAGQCTVETYEALLCSVMDATKHCGIMLGSISKSCVRLRALSLAFFRLSPAAETHYTSKHTKNTQGYLHSLVFQGTKL